MKYLLLNNPQVVNLRIIELFARISIDSNKEEEEDKFQTIGTNPKLFDILIRSKLGCQALLFAWKFIPLSNEPMIEKVAEIAIKFLNIDDGEKIKN